MRLTGLSAVLAAVFGLGLVWGAVPASAQTPTIALSFLDTNGSAVTAVGEDGGAQTVLVRARAASAVSSNVTVTVTVGASGGTATRAACASSGDYTPSVSSVTMTITSGGTTANSGNVTVTPCSDTVTEDHETIKFTGTASGYTVTDGDLRITDADRTVTITWTSGAGADGIREFPEGVGNSGTARHTGLTLTATLSGATSTLSSDFKQRIWLQHATADPNDVHPGVAEISPSSNLHTGQPQLTRFHRFVRIPAGSVSGGTVNEDNNSATFELDTTRDRKAEPNSQFTMHVGSANLGAGVFSGAAGWTTVQAVGRLVDSDSVVVLTPSSSSLAEGASAGTGLTFSAQFGPRGAELAANQFFHPQLRIDLSPSADGTATAEAADFAYSRPSTNRDRIIFDGGQGANRKNSQSWPGRLEGLSIVDDSIVEGPETLNVVGSLDLFYRGALTIVDDDTAIALSVSPSSAAERAAAHSVTVTATFAGSSSVLGSATDVTVTVAGGSGSDGATLGAAGDFTTDATNNTLTVSIPAGQVSGSASFNLTARDDGATEGAEKVELSGTASVGGSSVSVAAAELSITEGAPSIALSLTDTAGDALSSVGEEAGSAQTVRVVATASAATTANVSVAVTVGASGSTAGSGDYSASASSATVTIASGATSGYADVTVTPTSDTVVEGDETVAFTGTASGYGVSGVDLSIADDDDDIALSVSPSGVAERAAAHTVTVTAAFAGASSSALTAGTDVTVTVAGGSGGDGATLGASFDFTTDATNNMLTVTIAAGATSGSASFQLTARDDNLAEASEKVALSGAASVGVRR